MEERGEPGGRWRTLLYVALVVFVVAWILGVDALRSAFPVWLVFAVALGLELAFLAGAVRDRPGRAPDRGPQPVDRDRFGYEPPYADGEAAPAPARRATRLLAGLAMIAALAAVVWFVEGRTGWDALTEETRLAASERFSAEASHIAGKDVSVRCDVAGEFVGVVQHADGAAAVGGDTAYLTPEICLTLYRLAFDGDVSASRTGRALAVLAHEAWHLRGVRDEGEAECYALQSGVGLGRRLGLSEGRARQLMRQQLAENALRSGSAFEYRVPAGCREGGDLDLPAAGFP